MDKKYANVIVDISHEKVDRPFTYRIPEELVETVQIGTEVLIPFGGGNKQIHGYVVGFSDTSPVEEERTKSLFAICEKSVSPEAKLIAIAAFIRESYGSTMISALKTVLPVKKVTKALEKKTVFACKNEEELLREADNCEQKSQRAKARLLRELAESSEISYPLITGKLNVSAQTVLSLEKNGFLRIETTKEYRNPIRFRKEEAYDVTLSEEQRYVTDEIAKDYAQNNPGVYLLHGITGSGKTEVYMELIEQRLKAGQQAILLIPEISLTYQNVVRFYRRFGNHVSVMHSKLSAGERFDQFERAKKGDVSIMIGPRSALFTPFPNLGIIIIDEEHENSYKSETMPKYHAREVACKMGEMLNAGVVLGSATPSLESYSKAKRGEYRLFTLTKRLTGGELPLVYTVDLREELKAKNRSIFSRVLKEKIEERLEKNEQIMLFINRRGYAGFVSCRTCGKVIKCPHCDVSLSEHRNKKLVCHYCGYEQVVLKQCPECGSKAIAGFRAGTEQIEEAIHKEFPIATVLRMDADTTKHKDDYESILSAFSNGEADILLGTQMIVKGHDFPKVTLMGILAADLSLANGDYRAGERTFQLLTQAAGRAGRGKAKGEVVIQTYQPDHYAIIHAANQDYEGFYEEEMLYREFLLYPPAAHMMAVQISAPSQDRAETIGEKLVEQIKKLSFDIRPVQIGPAHANYGKLNDLYREVIYFKHKENDALIRIKDQMETFLFTDTLKKDETVQFDFNPMSSF